MTRRSERPPADPIRARDLDAAAALVFARDGFHGATVAAIARRAGVATGTFYLYYPSKEGCFLHLIARFYLDVLERVSSARREAPDTLGKLDASVRAVLEAFSGRQDLATMVLLRIGGSTPAIRQALERIADELWHLLAQDLEESSAAGLIAPGDSGLRARLVMGAMSDALLHGLRMGTLTGAQRDEVSRFVLGGLLARPRGLAADPE